MKPVIRCSELDQLLNCGASRILKQLVNPRAGGEGFEGTYGHWLIASRLINELGAWAPEGGLPPANVPAGYKFPDSSRWLVDFCFNTVKYDISPDDSLEVELPLAYEFPRFILSGHIDRSAINQEATRSTGSDWKLGRKPVSPAACNSQALGYIVLKQLAWPTLQQQAFEIVQPFNDPEEGFERVSRVEIEGGALDKCVSYLESQVNDALDSHDVINTGMTQCEWCPVGIQCPGIQAEQKMKLKLNSEMLARIRKTPDDALLGDMIVSDRITKKAMEDAEKLLHERIDANGQVVSGNGVTITRTMSGGSYKVINPVAMFRGLREIADDDKVAKALNYPVTRIKDMIAEAMSIPKSGKAEITAETVFAGKFGPHVEQGQRRELHFKAE